MANTVDAAIATMIANYEKNTGKPLEAWVASRAGKLAKHGEIAEVAQGEHGPGTATRTWPPNEPSRGDAPERAARISWRPSMPARRRRCKPAYDKLAKGRSAKFGADVESLLKKAYVSLRRSSDSSSPPRAERRRAST